MYNLIIKASGWRDGGRDNFSLGRVFEGTDDGVAARFRPNGQLDLHQLMALPTFFLQEGRAGEVGRGRTR
jgi:hypothetical protein